MVIELLFLIMLHQYDAFSSQRYTPTMFVSLKNSNSSPLILVGSNQFRNIASSNSHSMLSLRGGSLSLMTATPTNLFNTLLLSLSVLVITQKLFDRIANPSKSQNTTKPVQVKSLQSRFLIVFWLMRMADWLQGPYFFEVYSSKIINGIPVTMDLVSKLFLLGFATTGIFGPWIGRFVDSLGRKAGTLAFALFYAIGALSTRSSVLSLLLLGRIAGGLGTSLLFSAPEAWLVGEHQKNGFEGRWLQQTFGWAYAGDAIVAILAGKLASWANLQSGPTGPFTISVLFLTLGSLIALFKWNENVAVEKKMVEPQIETVSDAIQSNDTSVIQTKSKPIIQEALTLMIRDPRIISIGIVQALFEGAMYIFVLQWPPIMKSAILSISKYNQLDTIIPYGTIFSCFMGCCLLGSTIFSKLQSLQISVEQSTQYMLLLATAAISLATYSAPHSLIGLIVSFFMFEMCVGMYFPSIGSLRSKYLPDSHRSVIMNLFGIPLNLFVVSVFLSISKLGITGALAISTAALGLASLSMGVLKGFNQRESSTVAV